MKYGIIDFKATKFPENTPTQTIANNFEYVLQQRYSKDNGANYHYAFDFIHGNSIETKGWKITRITTFSAFKPKEILFKITDPNGKSDSDIGLINKTASRTASFIAFPGIGLTALNQGLALFKILTSYKNWSEFLSSNECGTYSIKMNEPS